MIWQALYKAMEYVPPKNRQEIRDIICSRCLYEFDDKELGCCDCLAGSMFIEVDDLLDDEDDDLEIVDLGL